MKPIKIFLIFLVLFISISAVSAEGNFTSLQEKIDASSNSIEITQDYSYDNTTDHKLNDGILINKTNYMINGNGYTIDGSSQARIFNIYGNNITISNLNFINANAAGEHGGAVYSSGSITLNNVTFKDNYADYGGAIYPSDECIINNAIFTDNTAEMDGGAIITWSTLIINNATFTNNSATASGGAIYSIGQITVTSSLFNDNQAEFGGAINTWTTSIITNTTLKNNQAESGGAIYAAGKTTIIDSILTNNTAQNGGALSARDETAIDNTIFTSNTAQDKGGAIFTNGNSNMANSIFKNNLANSGGAVYFNVFTNENSQLINNVFENNTANNGGAVYFNTEFNNNLIASTFIENKATRAGGAIYIKGQARNNTFTSEFFNNTAKEASGGINFFNTTDNININCNFTGNKATDGGAIYSKGGITINNASFNDNFATYEGGALYFENNFILINNVIFKNNYVILGDAIRCLNCTAKINNSIFKNENESVYGLIHMKDTALSIENSTFENSISTYNTGLYLENCSGKIKNSNFINLTAKMTGGAIGIKVINDEITIENSKFINVTSKNNGGAIYADVAGLESKIVKDSMNIINTSFIDCSSKFGGAILQLNGKLNIEKSEFINNSASISGGAIYASTIDFNLENSEFIDNCAFKNGGAIYIDLTNSTFDNTTFIGNTVKNSSILNPSTTYAYDTSLYIKNSLFNNSKYSLSSFFTVEYLDENNTLNDDEFSWNNTIYQMVLVDEGADIKLINNSINVNNIPSKFDLRDWGWVTPVKNQNEKGYCWAMSTIASLESAILKATGTEYDFSENNLGNNGIMYSIYGDIGNAEGGVMTTASGLILSWLNPISEENDSYDEFGKVSDIDTQNKIHIQDVLFIPVEKTSEHVLSNETNTLIKRALLEYASVIMEFAVDSESYNATSNSIYHSDVYEVNHIISIIGWDDAYSKDKFQTAPPDDGAWIIKNSWSDEWGDNGYAYISYYDTSLFGPDQDGQYTIPYTLAFIIGNSKNYKYNYQTDIMGVNLFNGNYTYYSNEYTAVANNLLSAVGTYFNDTGVDYEFKVYVNDELKLMQNGTSEFAGFKTIELNEYIPVKENDVFKVVFKNNVLPQQSHSRQHYAENVSFASADGANWIDYTSLNMTVCLKVYAFDLTIYTDDLVKIYKNDSKFIANVAKSGVNVTFEINGVNYTRISDENGTAAIAINLNPGNYTIKTTFNGTTVENTITVLPTLIADNLVKYFRNASQFYISLIDGAGKFVPNAIITMNIHGVFYNRTTNENGTAQLNINLEPGEYILTATDPLTGLMMSYNITVLPILTASDMNMTYLDGSTFNVNLVDGQGKPLSGASIEMNINGVFYYRSTNSSGIANLNIRLMPGEYIITCAYQGAVISNKITIVAKED
ncbi:MAG: hypothetical protein IJP99_09570 [Methanobrevibacter sp.]|nr:hypothetical protein [Methanobrevibacter sp.]